MTDRILEYAQNYFSRDVQEVSRIGHWEGYDVYEMTGDNLFVIGIPTYILAKGEKLRLTEGDESLGMLGGMIGASSDDD